MHQIGGDVTIFQGVKPGATQIDMNDDMALRAELDDFVVMEAGAKVLGAISLGDNVEVGTNSVLLRSVPADLTIDRLSCARSPLIQ
jgi:serine O-acetyltransferase